ncbi:MAG: extracellular solute-binding protein [Oscillospiraceae bacterium]|jgi:hypothetical protein|nr:extracellular solute-binding protein [Oscillospiraceae bacterium]
MKKTALVLALIMCFALAIPALTEAPTGTAGQAKMDGGTRVIRIATWYDHDMYDSSLGLEDLPNYFVSPEAHEAMYNNMKAVEEKYNVKFEVVRTTFEGIQISVDEGVLSGKPEADVYEADIQFGMPYALNGYLYALDDLVPADNDLWNAQQVNQNLKFPSQDKSYLFQIYSDGITVYSLGFNWTLLRQKGLENPQDLYARGEWTWDVFLDYCEKLTDLTAATPVYGFGGLWTNHLNGFLRSNGAQIAATPEGGLLSQATTEVLEMFKTLYFDRKVARPWNADDWAINNKYADGSVAFFTAADWIFNEGNGYYGGGIDYPLNWELGVVPYPVGPSGNQETNFHNAVTGNFYMIPLGVEDPAFVFEVYQALNNWYDFDRENTKGYDVLDESEEVLTWAEQNMVAAAAGNEELAASNRALNDFMSHAISFDPWDSVTSQVSAGDSGDFSMVPIMDGTMTPAQFQETYKQPLENALKTVYK